MKLRRPEFKKSRKARWRRRKRVPLRRLYRDSTASLAAALRDAMRLSVDELRWFRRPPQSDLAVSGPPTTLATSREVVPVNYGASGAARTGGSESRIPLIQGGS